MDRRTLLSASIAAIGSSVAGCLEGSNSMGDSDDSDGSADQTETDTTAPPDSETPSSGEESTARTETDDSENGDQSQTNFEVLNTSYDDEESASATFGDGKVTVTGVVIGNNDCYTARLTGAVIEDGRLVVSIESYEDAEEGQDCLMATIFIEYEAAVTTHGDLPTEVTVKHNGEQVTTEQRS